MPDGDGHHVLERAGDLAADDVGVRVDAEQVGWRTAACSSTAMVRSLMASTAAAASPARISLARFGPGEHAVGMAGQHLVDDLGHAQAAALLEALGEADHRHPGPQVVGHLLERRSGSRGSARP